jgi:uracil-DNA glycosylase family 4
MVLRGVWLTAALRCAPPGNDPTTEERDRCRPFLERELELLEDLRVLVCLGGFAHQVVTGLVGLRPRPRFGHGAETALPGGRHLLGSYHPSQQNTFTGKLTREMLDTVLLRARKLAGLGPPRRARGPLQLS